MGLNLGHVDVRRSRVTCWDLGGQADLRTLWDKYYAEVNTSLARLPFLSVCS